MKRACAATVALALLGLPSAGCEKKDSAVPVGVDEEIVLSPIASCAEIEGYLQELAVREMRARIEAEREALWERSRPDPVPPDDSGAPAGPAAWTSTNDLVAGVEQADFVKHDGTRIFVLARNALQLSRSWPAEELAVVSSVRIEGTPREMLLDEQDRVVVFSDLERPHGTGAGWPRLRFTTTDGLRPNAVKLTVIDVSDLAAPRVVREELLPGGYVLARRVGASVRVVAFGDLWWPEGVALWLDPPPAHTDRALMAEAYERLAEENERIIREAPFSQWVFPGQRRLADGSLEEVPYECTELLRSSGPTRLGVATVAELDLDDPDAPLRRRSVLARLDAIYASPDALYLAHAHDWQPAAQGQGHYTYLHRFDFSGTGGVRYQASGVVEGQVGANGLDEHEGHVRLASLRGQITVLAVDGARLRVVGRGEKLDENSGSVRFDGARAFFSIGPDPALLSFDLSDPAAPKQVGELKVPGLSTYLRPSPPDHLLALGEDGGAVKLWLFDVADPAAPSLRGEVTIGTGGESAAQREPGAFDYFAPGGVLVVPFVEAGDDGEGELRVFEVDSTAGLSAAGVVGTTGLLSPVPLRSVTVEGWIYGILESGILVAKAEAPETLVGYEPFR